MTSAALPPLPSIRAKELEQRGSSVPQGDESNGDGSGNINAATVEAPSVSQKEQSTVHSTNLRHNAPSSAPPESAHERSEQLAALHQKEQKVFGGLPPLESSVACNAIHHYISTTSSFLNSFIADANASHEGIDHKLTVLEEQMALLESKIASIPDLLPEEKEDEDGIRAEEEEKGEDEVEDGFCAKEEEKGEDEVEDGIRAEEKDDEKDDQGQIGQTGQIGS